jgi:hypothetical protein
LAFSEPQVGLVINYSFLWPEQAVSGQEEGTKDRPCAIILTTETKDGEHSVLVVPITHSPPSDMTKAVEIPAATKRRLGLDDLPSWAVTDCLNKFIWPGPDVRPVSPGNIAFGFLPKALTEKLIQQVLENHARGQVTTTPRSE